MMGPVVTEDHSQESDRPIMVWAMATPEIRKAQTIRNLQDMRALEGRSSQMLGSPTLRIKYNWIKTSHATLVIGATLDFGPQ